jgi:Mg-chelatase subunit ChlD
MSAQFRILALAILTGVLASCAEAQLAIPVHYENFGWECWSVRDRMVDISVRDQVASVTVTDNVVNPCQSSVEIQYLFPLPPEAAVDQFTLVVDGRELTGRILDADEARQVYNDIVRRRRDPGLLEYAGYGFYRSSAFPLGPHASAQLVVHYTATCKKDGDMVELWYPMTTGRFCAEPVGHFNICADIQSATDITNVYSPTVELNVERKSPNHIVTRYEAHGYQPPSDFQLFYQSSSAEVGATFLTYWPDHNKDGYYMMLVSPSPRLETSSVMAKDIVVLLDRSGSMSGEKIQQARDAARFVFRNLNPRDRFNLISYNDSPSLCFRSLQSANRRNIERALNQVDRVDAGGSTNIHAALDVAMSQFGNNGGEYFTDGKRPAFIIFLTDGLPTSGNTSETSILEDTRRANDADVRLFTFGVGYDVNVRLLDNLVNQNHGRSAYVKPNESIEAKVSSLYRRIKNPIMTGVTASISSFGTRNDCPAELGDLFEGDQLMRVGRIFPDDENMPAFAGPGDCPITLTISGMLQGKRQTLDYPVTLGEAGSRSSYCFIEKLWAVRRVGQLLEDIQLHGRVQEVVDELIQLSKQYGIVTPYTSFLANENYDLSATQEMRHSTMKVAEESAQIVTGPRAQLDASARAQSLSIIAPMAAQSNSGHAKRMGAPTQVMYESGVSEEINTIRIVGNETLYKRGDTWVTASIANFDPVRDRAKFTVISRYTDPYFTLVRENTAEENQVFASQKPGEKLAILLRGTAYLIE